MGNEVISVKELVESESRFDRCKHGDIGFTGNAANSLEARCTAKSDDGYVVIDKSVCDGCELFDSRYIEFPIEVDDIIKHPLFTDKLGLSCAVGSPVAVRPCDPDLGGKTYLGIYVGDLVLESSVGYNPKTKQLEILNFPRNPCILVPELGCLVWGYESWWQKIDPSKDLKDITDEDIENVWYMKALKRLFKPGGAQELDQKIQDESSNGGDGDAQ